MAVILFCGPDWSKLFPVIKKFLKFIRAGLNTLFGKKLFQDRLTILKMTPAVVVLPWRETSKGAVVYLLGHRRPESDNQEHAVLKIIGSYIGEGESPERAARRVLDNKGGIKAQSAELILANQTEVDSALEGSVKIFQIKLAAAPNQVSVPVGSTLVELPLRKALGLAREGRLRDLATTTALWQLAYDQEVV